MGKVQGGHVWVHCRKGLRDGATPGFLPEPTMPCPSHQGPVTVQHLCEVK